MRIFFYVALCLQAIDSKKLSIEETCFLSKFLEQQGLDNILIINRAGSKMISYTLFSWVINIILLQVLLSNLLLSGRFLQLN